VAAVITRYEAALPSDGWPNWVLGNHDRPRVAARRGQAQARVAAVLLLTLRGTPTLYYGDELGLSDVAIEPSQVRDPRELREPGLGLGRDPVRTPMPWDDGENAGFTGGMPWLPLHADWPTRNVKRMAEEPQSLLTLYRRLLALRRDSPALSIGDFALLNVEDETLVYARRHGEARLIVALNFGERQHRLELPDWARGSRVLLSSAEDATPGETGTFLLRPNEAVVLEAR
jgi:glycosidase